MMAASSRKFALNLMGSFRLLGPGGERIDIASRKGMAMVAMLALAEGGERTRGWLQEKLWGQRDRPQAQGSLRRELTHLRDHLNVGPKPLLICERQRVMLDLSLIDVDALMPRTGGVSTGDFLEGFDLAGEEGFEDWLREQRGLLEGSVAPTPALAPDVEPSPAGFGDRPALAILPFANLTADTAHDYLCEGLSEDLIDRLSRLRWLPVIARSSSFAFASDRVDLRVVGQKLGAKYVLEGRLKRTGGDLSIAVSLSDATSGYSLWSHRVPLPPDRSQDALDPLVAELVGVLDAQIDYAEQVRARGNRQNRLEFNDLIWRGRWHLNRLTRTDSELARRLFDQALELEPESPEAIIQQTFCMGWSLWAKRGGDAEVAEMRQLAHRAIVADPDDGRGHMLAGIAEMWLRQPGRARTLFERAIALNPSLCQAHAELGCHYNLVGEPAKAIAPLRLAQRLSPNDVHSFFFIGELALSHWMLGEWQEAVDHADQSLVRRPAYWYALVIKINALVGARDLDAARRAYDELMTVTPDFTPQFIDWTPFIDRAWNRRLAEGVAAVTEEPATKPGPARRRR
ncbi:MAG: tetratricopeptide repeat protein [Reyranella sp.]|nr:tetratricopeptide repeat protein [Reyranella sp.]